MRLLIVDDSKTIRMLLRSLLAKIGYTDVDECDSAEAALSKLAAGPFDGMLLDVHLPGKDGLTVLKQLREDAKTAQLPVVMISSDNDIRNVELAKNLGANGFIRKPFSQDGLAKTLGAILGKLK